MVMGASMIDNHLSFRPASEILRAWATENNPTPPDSDVAISALAAAKAAIKRRPAADTSRLTAQAWGVTKMALRRYVLSAAGLDVNRWDCPIHSFTDAERIAMRAAAAQAGRSYERVRNAI